MNDAPFAVMDLGSNTFHLLIFTWVDAQLKTLYSKSTAAKLGLGGFGDQGLQPEAMDRGIAVLQDFKQTMDAWGVERYRTIATSALRQASNQAVFVTRVLQEVGIHVEVISGMEEASLIYDGVRMAVPIDVPSLIMDIGGGSVEFILTDQSQVVWQTSLEIGGLRLMEKFHKFDPLPLASIDRLQTYLRDTLLPVTNAVHQYAPQVLVGSSGSFDTLVDMWWLKTKQMLPPDDHKHFVLPNPAFFQLYREILPLAEADRRELPGMIPLRSGMISMALVLIEHVINSYHLQEIHVSRYSLKEGACNSLRL